jgi:hypothetical protein
MKINWPNGFSQGFKRKWLLSAFYCVLLSISFLMDMFNPATKRMLCQDFSTAEGHEGERLKQGKGINQREGL